MSPPCVASEVHTGVDLQCLASDRRSTLLLTVLGSSMAFMDGSVVNVALPTLQASFRASSYHILWVVQSYSLLGSALLLFCGALGDRFGRMRIYLLGVAVFALASIGCAASFNLSELILARAIQGFGAALLIPQALAILSNTYPEGERAGAIGTWSAWTSVSIALGPIVGGWLIQVSGWRAIFLLNIPFTLWIIWLAPKLRRTANDQPPVTSFPLDYRGAMLNILGFAAIVFALSFVPQLGWKDPRISLSLLTGFVLLFVFVLSQRRSPNPLVPLSLFRSAAFSGANVLTFLAYGALGGAFYIVPYFLIGARHLLPSSAGAAFLPMIAIMFAFSGRVGTIAAKVGEVKFMVVGSALTAGGFALLGLVSKETRYAFGFLPGVLLLGVGITLTVAPLTSFLMSSVVASRRGVASAVNNSVSRLGGLIAVSVVAVAVSHTFNLELGRQLQSSGLPVEMQHVLVSTEGLMLALPIPQKFGYSQTLRAKAIVQHSFVTAYRDVMFGCAFTTFLGTLVIVWTARKSQSGMEAAAT